jgi:FkbM family methyltransferase
MIILAGAGTTGRVIARDLAAKGEEFVFADNDESKWGSVMEGVPVFSPAHAKESFPDATWIASVVRPERHEIIAQIAAMGVKSVPMWDFVPKRYNLPPKNVCDFIYPLLYDKKSIRFWDDQILFRSDPEHHVQIPQSNIDHIYFEDFITPREDEHYVDCGAADGDTIRDFLKWSPKYKMISAFEPDDANFEKLCAAAPGTDRYHAAVSDYTGYGAFTATGDYSSSLNRDGKGTVVVKSLDTALFEPPTFIKMDIEGSELEALWGARRILKEYKPVLAVCAYHEAEHLWEIPLLIHALQPEYEFFLRRYAESTFETVWYAVPAERVRR